MKNKLAEVVLRVIFMRPMRLKDFSLILVLALITIPTVHAKAEVTISFPGWDTLIQSTPDIIVARCNRTPDPYKDHGSGPTGPVIDSSIEIVSILKGETNWGGAQPLKAPVLGSARMSSEYSPFQGEYYLIFSVYYNGYYQAMEKYRVIPIGLSFTTNDLGGKTLDEQIQMLLQRRLNTITNETDSREEINRLQEGLIK
jgi:hypothetical protein